MSIKRLLSFHILFATFMLASCLPIDERIPECFPSEACPLGTACIAGKCQSPNSHTIGFDTSCLDTQCQATLENYTSSNQNQSSESSDISKRCLVLVQKHQVQVSPVALDQAEVTVNIFEEDTQAFLLLIDHTQSCPQFDQLPQKDLSDLCQIEQGCHMYLRAAPLKVQYQEQQVFNFTYEDGQCLSSVWILDIPSEVCDQGDNDCDGFVDEGVSCDE